MTKKHRPISGFRIAQPAARRGCAASENRPIRLSEIKQLIGELITSERHHHGQAHAMLAPAGKPASPPQRKVFDVGRIDRSRSQLRVISMADAEARCRRETLMHFGLDPDQ
ncbi:hypothetical protein WJ96_23955 [Burkholderia ubonensis]|uniref:Uncharacterized protein n=1 Tax=Burkholderia ubonensis TaxID=101571 RepID=A0AAW3MHG7_9BURK|nr:hypothetical protein [Burkholderia ubonensis]KVP85282.1 hypothetical protein WJ96_23955 [Burkholderia ubonensis]KWA02367.1 hypothetical protein WL25_03295 [Burkholderia ubonensis]